MGNSISCNPSSIPPPSAQSPSNPLEQIVDTVALAGAPFVAVDAFERRFRASHPEVLERDTRRAYARMSPNDFVDGAALPGSGLHVDGIYTEPTTTVSPNGDRLISVKVADERSSQDGNTIATGTLPQGSDQISWS